MNNVQEFAKSWHEIYAHIFQYFKHWNVHVLRYEDLTNSTHHYVPLDAIRNTIKFMRHGINETRIRCAYELAAVESMANITTIVSMDQGM